VGVPAVLLAHVLRPVPWTTALDANHPSSHVIQSGNRICASACSPASGWVGARHRRSHAIKHKVNEVTAQVSHLTRELRTVNPRGGNVARRQEDHGADLAIPT
jgi:hypothetical protein